MSRIKTKMQFVFRKWAFANPDGPHFVLVKTVIVLPPFGWKKGEIIINHIFSFSVFIESSPIHVLLFSKTITVLLPLGGKGHVLETFPFWVQIFLKTWNKNATASLTLCPPPMKQVYEIFFVFPLAVLCTGRFLKSLPSRKSCFNTNVPKGHFITKCRYKNEPRKITGNILRFRKFLQMYSSNPPEIHCETFLYRRCKFSI